MKQEIAGGYITDETKNGITTIEFYHPQSNAMPSALLQGLTLKLLNAAAQQTSKVIILRSGGSGAFCAGASFNELHQISTKEEGKAFFMGFANVLNAMRKCHQVIIARIQGKSVGGGLGIAAAADYAIAAEGADVKLSELSIGIGPFVIEPAIERKIGIAALSQLTIDAAMWRPADWARRKGLYAELHPSVMDMDESIFRLSNELAGYNPDALIKMKQVLWKNTDHWDELLPERAAISGELVLSDYTKKALEKSKLSAYKKV